MKRILPISVFFVAVAAVGGFHYSRWENGSDAVEIDQAAACNFDMDQRNGTIDDVPKWLRAMEGKRVKFSSRMLVPHYPENGNIIFFQAVPPMFFSDSSRFRVPLAQLFIDCEAKPGVHVEYYGSPVRITGIFHVHLQSDQGLLRSVFHVDVEKVEPLEEKN